MAWVDIALLSVLGLSMLVGLMRGLVFEVMSLLGWVVAYFAAQWFAQDLAPHLPLGAPGSAVNLGAAFVALFIAVLVVWGIATRLIAMLIKASPVSLGDRLLGAGFGFMRGMVLLLVVATVVALTPLARTPGWRDSQGAVWLNGVLNGLKPILPPKLAQYLPA